MIVDLTANVSFASIRKIRQLSFQQKCMWHFCKIQLLIGGLFLDQISYATGNIIFCWTQLSFLNSSTSDVCRCDLSRVQVAGFIVPFATPSRKVASCSKPASLHRSAGTWPSCKPAQSIRGQFQQGYVNGQFLQGNVKTWRNAIPPNSVRCWHKI